MIKEHERVVLKSDLPKEGLRAGDVGTVIHIHGQGEAFVVEFFTLAGKTVTIATVDSSQARPVSARDLTHARQLEAAA
ncbi:MAG: DUF4926 domain-containing protein [Nitrospirae bacterium]|nr:DUF4926 domain-containing protein [Nitrospirota bacterium]